jgi:hypothetical protein
VGTVARVGSDGRRLVWRLPPGLEPSWGRLPRLSWVAVTGLVPEGALPFRALAAPACLFTGPLLAAARFSGQLAALAEPEGWSVLIVLHRRRAKLLLMGVFLAILLVGGSLVVKIMLWSWLLFWAGIGLGGYLVLLWAIGALLLIAAKWRRRGGPPVMIPSNVIELTCAASWPRQARRGSALWDKLRPALAGTGRPVVARAVTTVWAGRYASRTSPPGEVFGCIVLWRDGQFGS